MVDDRRNSSSSLPVFEGLNRMVEYYDELMGIEPPPCQNAQLDNLIVKKQSTCYSKVPKKSRDISEEKSANKQEGDITIEDDSYSPFTDNYKGKLSHKEAFVAKGKPR